MEVEEILKAVQAGQLDIARAKDLLGGFQELGFAKVDLARKKRTGQPEIIYGESKTTAQIIEIAQVLLATNPTETILITRVADEKAAMIQACFQESSYEPVSRCLIIGKCQIRTNKVITIVTAGTSDLLVAKEAEMTAKALGNPVKLIMDVGVAGLNRLLARLEELRAASVIIVIAGMEGALASVIGGLVEVPVIAVPTSIGYGANFHGLSALLSMLNSCAAGVSVVNIDNGFGAAYNASLINQAGE